MSSAAFSTYMAPKHALDWRDFSINFYPLMNQLIFTISLVPKNKKLKWQFLTCTCLGYDTLSKRDQILHAFDVHMPNQDMGLKLDQILYAFFYMMTMLDAYQCVTTCGKVGTTSPRKRVMRIANLMDGQGLVMEVL